MSASCPTTSFVVNDNRPCEAFTESQSLGQYWDHQDLVFFNQTVNINGAALAAVNGAVFHVREGPC